MSYILDKAKDDFLTLDVGDKLVNTDDTALMKYEKKFMQKAVSIMYTVFSFKKLQIAVNKDVIDIDNYSLQKWSPMASDINREEFLGISFSHHMEILHKTKDLHEIIILLLAIFQIKTLTLFRKHVSCDSFS